jgi:hypothetical protein
MYDPPCNTPQGHAVTRMFLLGNIIIHHLNQQFMAKSDLDRGYPSLKHLQLTNEAPSIILFFLLFMQSKTAHLLLLLFSELPPLLKVFAQDTRIRERNQLLGEQPLQGQHPKEMSTNGTPKYQQIQQNHNYMQGSMSAVECQCIELTQKQRVTKGLGVEAILRSAIGLQIIFA